MNRETISFVGSYEDMDRKILRYMDILELLNILSGTFSVRKKSVWPDLRESGKSCDNLKYLAVFGEKVDEDRLQEYGELCKKLRESKDMLASCWTLNQTESMLMWSAYTQKRHGVLLKTTVGDFIASLGLSNYSVMGHSVNYGISLQGKSYLEALFTKDKYYKEEQEYRFYFEPNESGSFCVDPQKLVNSVVLDPFLDGRSFKAMAELLTAKYSFLKKKICESKIKVACRF